MYNDWKVYREYQRTRGEVREKIGLPEARYALTLLSPRKPALTVHYLYLGGNSQDIDTRTYYVGARTTAGVPQLRAARERLSPFDDAKRNDTNFIARVLIESKNEPQIFRPYREKRSKTNIFGRRPAQICDSSSLINTACTWREINEYGVNAR